MSANCKALFSKLSTSLRYVGVIQSLSLIKHLYLMSMWFGEKQTKSTIMMTMFTGLHSFFLFLFETEGNRQRQK